MKSLSIGSALVLSVVAGLATLASAMPPPVQVAGNPAVIPVNGCHSDIRKHYVMELGRSVLHYHHGPDCTPVIVDEDDPNRRGPSD